ncbi:MAG: peptidase, partial [Eggerthellaceae bacterium]|nr:peptidase [Eggerthellaceae bacterium]
MTVSKKDRHRNQLLAKILASFIALVAAFALGFVVRSQPAFVGALGFNVEGEPGVTTSSHTVKTTYDSVSARISEVEDILAQGSLDTYELDAATESLIQNLMEATGDSYATYLSPERYEAYVKESTANDYEGVGILFAEYNGRAYVADVFEGSEAETKGVKQGDFVSAIDGKGDMHWTLSEVLNVLGSEEDGSVVITWLRTSNMDAETGEEFTTTLSLSVYEKANLDVQLDGEVGYMRLRQLSTNSAEMVQASLIDLADQGATS